MKKAVGEFDNGEGFLLGALRGSDTLEGPFCWTDGPVPILRLWFGPDFHTRRRLDKPALLRTKKTARSVIGDSINILGEVVLTVTHWDYKETHNICAKKNIDKLYGTDWIEKNQRLGLPYEHFLP